ncbi:LytTR family DNA-binding domain-containing protein [Deefgea tanakiae]|uniref:LytTR family DNA-binding domain-containing protein n=1 Tax=Deefgea tanakiae TaxID=2865840 RepID=A0ABX8ZDP9_9NEIS|nr:LytTR family DNA-binding domain-containing protein [Deefgea tanakiae]QZA79275.1 LytTR family DNA-binding domain-containing protein [Deefgea tanakiae]
MPTALIADDEPLLMAALSERIRALWPELDIVASAKNGIEALSLLSELQPDFAFLDIRMPGLTGLQVAENVRNTRVIFVTAFDEYALAAFAACAIDYLLKPVSNERLAQCISRLQREAAPKPDWPRLSRELTSPIQPSYLQWLTASLGDTTRLIAIDEVRYFQATEKYTEVVTLQGRFLIRTSLKELLPQLNPQRFLQIHRSYIVCLPTIDRIEKDILGRQTIYLKDSTTALPLSRSHAAQFKQM